MKRKGNIIHFPRDRIVRLREQRAPPEGKKLGSLWRLADLRGGHPDGHPSLNRDQDERPLFAVDQVWVEISSTFLWVITAIYPAGRFQKCRVRMRPYKKKGQFNTVVLSETTVRGSMWVWDDVEEPARPMQAWLERSSETSPSLYPQALAESTRDFLGVDKDGFVEIADYRPK